jgi:hypothetical protein
MTFLKRLALTLAVLALLPSAARAQAVGGASIAGTVKDTSGAVLPGVSVEAASPVLIEKVRSVTTDASGQYKIENLRPGMYSVTFTLAGFSTIKREGIELAGTFVATINADLMVGNVSETITVTTESPIVDLQSSQRQRVFSQEVLDAIPAGRSHINEIVLLPGVNASQPGRGGLQDVGGTNNLQNTTFSIHGGRTTTRACSSTASAGQRARRASSRTSRSTHASKRERGSDRRREVGVPQRQDALPRG